MSINVIVEYWRSVKVQPILQPTGKLKHKFAAWLASWRPLGADRLSLRGSKVNSCIWLRAVDDNTINIVLCIIIIIMITIRSSIFEAARLLTCHICPRFEMRHCETGLRVIATINK